MPFPLAAIGLGVAAAGTASNLFTSLSGAAARRRERDEQLRRFEADATRTVSGAAAAGAASGVDFDSGSLQTYLKTMTDEFRRQADLMRSQGRVESNLDTTSAILGAATGVGGALFQYGTAKNWWREPTLQPGSTPQYVPGSGAPLWR